MRTSSPLSKFSFQFLFLFLFLFSSAFPQKLISSLDNYLKEYYKNKNIPSISAGVSSNDVIIWTGAEGYIDLENHIPANQNSVYRVASISKSITAVAIMQLVEKGKINLDEDVRKYIPYFPRKKWKFTTRQILSHTSGIRNYNPGEFDSKEFFPSIKKAVEVLIKDSLVYQPGTKYLYSTLAYNLLAAIIENVSGIKFETYIKKNIFGPAEMNSTYLDFQKNIIKNRARGYLKDEFRKFTNAPLADLSIKYPGGGIISTSYDLLNFANSLLEEKLIKRSTLDTMLVPIKLKNGTLLKYGLGFGVDVDSKKRKYFFHSGGGTGFTSFLLIYPKEKLSSVYLINARDRNLDNPARDLLSIVFGEDSIKTKKSMADKLLFTSLNSDVDSALSEYRMLKKDSSAFYEINESELILFGNDLLNTNNAPGAITLFKYLVNEFPNNKDVFMGLANAYNVDGNKGLAIKNYKVVLKLDPSNSQAALMLKKLVDY